MKKFLLFVGLMLCNLTIAQTVLNQGDLALIGLDTNDEVFSFVVLVDMLPGTEIYFTDEEFGGTTFSTNEGTVLYTVPTTGYVAGTVIIGDSNGTEVNFSSTSDGAMVLGNSGDGVTAYQGTLSSPSTILFAIGEDSGDIGNFYAGPQLLIGADNGDYQGVRSGDSATLFQLFQDSTNYNTNGNSLGGLSSTSFAVNNGPATTSLQFDPNSLTVNEDAGTVDLTVSISNESTSNATTADVVLTSGTASSIDNYTTQSVTFPAGRSVNQTVTITITDDMIEELDKDFTFEIQNIVGGDMAAAGTNNTFTLTVLEDDKSPISLPYIESFNDCGGSKWVAFDQAGDDVWVCESGAYAMNGFGGTEDIDWLITEVPVDFPMAASLNQIEVTTSERFGNTTNEAGEFLLRYSTDYNGAGDPTMATWTDLIFNPNNTSSGSSASASSVATVDASAIQGQAYIAFLYDNTGLGAEEWIVEEINITTLPADANLAPSLTNILNSPAAPTSTELVTVNVDVTDADGLSSVELQYGFASGVYDQTPIVMVLSSGDTYQANIPAQVDGTTVFYQIVAIDANASPETATSVEQNYIVLDPQPQGLQIDVIDRAYLIDFDNTVANVNNGTFDGSGFLTAPAVGQLDADAFAIDGLQDATTNFGEEQSGNDFGKGFSDGGVSSGGIYAFEVAVGDYALGVQPTGRDFTPGTVFFRFTNNTGTVVTDLSVAYDFYVFDNENRANDFRFSHGADVSSLTEVTGAALSSMLGQDAIEEWKRNAVAMDLTGLNIAAGDTYVLAWSSVDSGSGSSDEIALDNIQLIANPSIQKIALSGVLESLTLLGDVSLSNTTEVNGFLNLISGDLTTNNNLTLKSINGKSAVVREVLAGTVTGDVMVEQFYPAQRAFRFIGSSVDMTGSLFDNWQQGGLNVGDTGYVPETGTHITGGTIADGFDASGSNNPSAFSFNEGTQLWESISTLNGEATNSTNLTAGDALRVLIRGDRSVSLTTAGTVPSNTTLISTGSLYLGDFTASGLSTVEGSFNFVGNPYQAQVNLNSVLNDAATQDINANQYYAWDPTIGTRGAYVTHDFVLGNSNTTSDVNEFIQPGQAFFVSTTEDGRNAAALEPSISFKESHKSTSFETSNTYRNSNVNEQISINLYTDQELLSANKARDGVLISFNLNESTAISTNGALKLLNPDENLSIEALNSSFSIMQRVAPVDNEIIPLKLNGLTASNYTFDINNTFTNLQTLFVDHFLGTETLLVNGSNLIRVSFDSTHTASLNENRFELKFINSTLSVGDIAFAEAVQVYPNPVNGDRMTIANLIVGEAVKFSIYNVLGQLVVSYQKESTNGSETVSSMNNLSDGVYLLRVEQDNAATTIKFVKN